MIEIQRICQLAHERGLRELAISQPSFSLTVKTMPQAAMAARLVAPPAVLEETIAREPVAPAGYIIPSPLVGIFYRASAPDAPPCVEIGETVEAGQTIGIVEAMKVFNEITADRPGTVIAIPARNGELVQVDQPLVILTTAE